MDLKSFFLGTTGITYFRTWSLYIVPPCLGIAIIQFKAKIKNLLWKLTREKVNVSTIAFIHYSS